MGKGFIGDFIGFTFNNIHSSTLGITRVSDGSRYTDDLLPAFQDKVAEIPGSDGTYFFGTYYKQKPINISIAFDDLTESQLRQLKQFISDKQVHELWFDETPYKAYNAKITGSPSLKYICFDKMIGNNTSIRVYKGEGTLNFIAYYPFAHSRFKYLNDYDSAITNKLEWLPASGIRVKGDLDTPIKIDVRKRLIRLWNGGDFDTDFNLNIYFSSATKLTYGSIKINNKILTLKEIQKKGIDEGVQFNSRLNLIQGFIIRDGKIQLTNNLYNEYISSGNFFQIPVGESEMYLDGLYDNVEANGKLDIEYQYLYL